MSKWLSIFLEGENLEEKCSLLFEFGVAGSTICPDGSANCFYQSEDGTINSELSSAIEENGLTLIRTEVVEEKNWTHTCDALFEAVQVGALKILPLKSFDESIGLDFNQESDILIIPGTGFGTGHHATTFNLLKLLQHPELKTLAPKAILDAGTGSGILAIGACRLFDCKIDAYEVDSLAVENAQENVALNKFENRIKLYCESVHRCEQSYDLVIANLYAELLEMLCSHLVGCGNERAYYLLSGIRADLVDGVIKKYEDHGLICLEKVISEGWAALMFNRLNLPSTPNHNS